MSRSIYITENVISDLYNCFKLATNVYLSLGNTFLSIKKITDIFFKSNKSDLSIKTYMCIFKATKLNIIANISLVKFIKNRFNDIDDEIANYLAFVLSTMGNTKIGDSSRVLFSLIDQETISVTCSFKDFYLIKKSLDSKSLSFKHYIDRD